jgi:hypothetical protein
VAQLTVTAVPKRPAASQRSSIASLAYVNNLIFRARYAIAAMRRIEAWVQTEEAPLGVMLEDAMMREAGYFKSHQHIMKQRVAAAKTVEAAVERWGPVLGWRLGHCTESRSSHVDADGQNFDTRRGVPVSTGGLPGASPGCMCLAVAPFEGSSMLR